MRKNHLVRFLMFLSLVLLINGALGTQISDDCEESVSSNESSKKCAQKEAMVTESNEAVGKEEKTLLKDLELRRKLSTTDNIDMPDDI